MTLWSIFKGSEHIGWALGDSNKTLLQRAMGSGFSFYRTSHPIPVRWASMWLPIWKSYQVGSGSQYGAFKQGWNLWVTWQLQKLYGYTAAVTREDSLTRVARN